MPTALAISPHLDDAVFSAGGTLARLAQNGWRVVVATVFTASVPDPCGFALACQLDKGIVPDIDYMALRRGEDAAACAIIGAEPIWLPFQEAPHRGYGTAAALFAGLHGDDAIVGTIAPALACLVDDLSPTIVLAPQAVGAHVDHAAVYLAMPSCACPMWLWVDFPYSVRDAERPAPFADDIVALGERAVDCEAGVLEKKLGAVLAYASQLGFQFGGPDEARAAIASTGARERFAVREATRR